MKEKIKVGLVGYGYWGPNLMRNLVACPSFEVVALIDTDKASHEKCQSLYPFVKAYTDLDSFLDKENPDAVVIATPPGSHDALAQKCINSDAHVLIEKPLTLSVSEARSLLDLAKRKNKKVMVDHTFLYNPAVLYLTNAVKNKELGDLLYFDSTRVNLGGFQPQTNVLWDLAPHDLSILDAVTEGKLPQSVSAYGVKHFNSDVETMCYATLRYNNNFLAHLNLNWAAPVKTRKIVVGGNIKMIEYDDNNPTEKIKIYDKGVNLEQNQQKFRASYRSGDMLSPALPHQEPLACMVQEFADSIIEDRPSKSDGLAGLRVVQMLEALSLSMENNGAPIEINNLEKILKAS